jgi:hypothetical protein
MKLSSIYMCVLLAFLQVDMLFAGPPQRLIIQFDTPLSTEQKKTLNLQILSIIKSGFSVLPHGTEQRWIIAINSPLDKSSLEKAIEEISRLEQVKYAEPDQVVEVFR